MLISREDLRFDFKRAQFDMKSEKQRKLLAWIFDQFLYGEASGIQCGYWLYRAPHLNAATFLAKQASEELSHFRRILRIFSVLGEKPSKAHWAVRFLSSGMMGGSWGEHVAIEMALGEGLVLSVFYAMEDTIPEKEIRKILTSAISEEEKHVEFGERETSVWLGSHPRSRNLILGLALVQLWVLRILKNYVVKKLNSEFDPLHPVLSQFDVFYDHVVRCFELRIERLGLCPVPVHQIGTFRKICLIAFLPFRIVAGKITERFKLKKLLLTETYLDDPALVAELQRFPLSSSVHE